MSDHIQPFRIWTREAPTRIRFGDLRHLTLDDYLALAPQQAFWFFQHIPKTAGSSFTTELRMYRGPYHNICVDAETRLTDYDAGLAASLDRFLDQPALLSVRSASGHLLHPMTRKIWEHVPSMEMITMLRHPVSRVISEYRYQRSALHVGAEAFRVRYPTLSDYVESPESQNRMAYFIGDANADEAELMARIERDYAFVGLVEMYQFSFNTAFALMGLPGSSPDEYVRRTPDNADTAVEVGPDMRKRIARLNRRDMALFRQVRAILAPHVREWRNRRQTGRSAQTAH